MNTKRMKNISAITMALLLSISAAGCSEAQIDSGSGNAAAATQPVSTPTESNPLDSSSTESNPTTNAGETSTEASAAEGSVIDPTELFSDRDLEQSADLTAATSISLESGKDVTLTAEGVYVISGEVEDTTVVVEAAEDAKIQIVLDGVSIVNEDAPAIYVKAGDKVFVTSTNSENVMEVTGSYVADGDTNLDAVIFSRSDVTLNGTGTLDIISSEGNGISSKDDLKITGGVYHIEASADALEANDAILIYDGDITIETDKDALHSENEEDASLGYVYIQNGTIHISAADDAIYGNSYVQIDGGTINIENSAEGIESNYIQINDGQIAIYATDDGINATQKVNSNVGIEVNGGTIEVKMGSGDTDAFDSNGDLYINGGTIIVEGASAFDADGTAQLNGGDVTVNGQQITEITPSRGGGGGRGGRRPW